jgi:hypothetical protein
MKLSSFFCVALGGDDGRASRSQDSVFFPLAFVTFKDTMQQ